MDPAIKTEEPPASMVSAKPETDTPPQTGWQSTAPFRVLGYSDGSYFYMPDKLGQVQAIRGNQHNKPYLLPLAKIQFWERSFPGKQGADWDAAGNALLRASEDRGIYDPSNIRGRGVWEDAGRSVLNLGSCLIVDGERIGNGEIDSEFNYPRNITLEEKNLSSPLPSEESAKIIPLIKLLPWDKVISAVMLAGWCVVAVVCGGMRWRPHIWVTGGVGTGKSTVIKDVIRPILGRFALLAQSNTTEAGLRQKLKFDSLPVVFDEAEGEDKKAAARMQNVLELARQASSESGAGIIKGSKDGQATEYKIRSCFAFSSVGVGIKLQSDASRITVLELGRKVIDYKHFKEEWKKTLGQREFCDSLRARIIQALPDIKANAETFAQAVAEHFGSHRTGDQIGALLAGAYALYRTDRITIEAAREWVQRQDWGEEKAELEESRDELRCLMTILSARIRVQGEQMTHELTLGEAAKIAITGAGHNDIGRKTAEDTVRRYGLRGDYEDGFLTISKSATEIGKILSDTPWGSGWGKQLERIEGAEKPAKTVYFTAGVVTRAVNIPESYII